MIDKIMQAFKNREEVDAILLGGSRAGQVFDENSDYDFYVYLNTDLEENIRKSILKDFARYMEYSNQYFELEDDGVLKNGVEVEFIYRHTIDIDKMMGNLIVKQYVNHGYTTCFLDNLLNSKIVFDKKGALKALKTKYEKRYPDELKDAIIMYNYPILLDQMPSLYYQVEKAVKRSDLHSINHRITAYFEIYYDVLFALNKTTHPGEKRLLEFAKKLKILPLHFELDVRELFSHIFQDNEAMLKTLYRISERLYDLLVLEGYEIGFNRFDKK